MQDRFAFFWPIWSMLRPMACSLCLCLNKQGAGYPVEPVWIRGAGRCWRKFVAAWCRPMAGIGSIDASESAPAWPVGAENNAPTGPYVNQALSVAGSGQVARIKSHGLGKGAVFCGAWCKGRRIASYQTGRGAIDPAPAGRALAGRRGTPPFPLSVAAAPPYPGRAGQTQDLEKPAQGPACAFGCAATAAKGARKPEIVPVGSGVWAALIRKSLSRGRRGIVLMGSGVAAAGRHGFRLDRCKTMTLGVARS